MLEVSKQFALKGDVYVIRADGLNDKKTKISIFRGTVKIYPYDTIIVPLGISKFMKMMLQEFWSQSVM